ncbi:MAG: Mth938-like domain-containing protein [Thermodesulfobacteriota bacterium]
MIEDYSFGRIKIKGRSYSQDVKILTDGRVQDSWWRRTGHQVDVSDVQDILEENPEVLVLGKGSPGLMQSTSKLGAELQKRGIQLIELPSQEAATRFNELYSQGKRVCAGFHLTC